LQRTDIWAAKRHRKIHVRIRVVDLDYFEVPPARIGELLAGSQPETAHDVGGRPVQ
jgi:hypothetical protein